MAAYESFAEVYDLFMDQTPYDLWCAHIIEQFRNYRVPQGLVAELGCGTGKMTRRLAAAGYDMIGIDHSEEMLSVAMEHDATGILYLCQDMRSFELYGTVGAIVSVCDSMNYLTATEDLVQVIKLANNYLDPGGIFLFDLNTRYKYEQILADHIFAENRDEGSFIWENTFDEASGMNEYDLTLYLCEDEKTQTYRRYEETHFQRAYTVPEVEAAVVAGGMKLLAVLDADTMGELTDTTERIYVIAREQGK